MASRLTAPARVVLAVALCVAIVVVGAIGYRHYVDRYTVTRRDDGLAVARVVAASLYRSSDLRVSRLSGTVQATAASSSAFGMLNADRVMKAPFEVGYFVDLGALTPSRFRYDAERKVLMVDVPDIQIGRPDIDEARTTLDRTTGLFVTRTAMADMQRTASQNAQRVAAAEARKPENIVRAKENARAALTRLFTGTLRAAQLDATVEVRFADDPVRNTDRWDLSSSLEEVLGNAR